VAITPDGFRVPGTGARPFYDFGIRYRPWPGLPHRAGAFVTNKQVASERFVTDDVTRRFDPGLYYVLELEAYL
jgi:hypothetical protein